MVAQCDPVVHSAAMTDTIALTPEERDANLDLDQLKQLVGLVAYDESKDPFPVTGWDALVFVVGNATQTAHYYQSAYGMELVAYSGPETGNRDHKAFVLKSGSCRFVVKGGVAPESPVLDHHRKHGDGVAEPPRICSIAHVLDSTSRSDPSSRVVRTPAQVGSLIAQLVRGSRRRSRSRPVAADPAAEALLPQHATRRPTSHRPVDRSAQ